MDGQSAIASSPGGVSSSTIRSEMRVLPVPHGRISLPRAWPAGSPPLSDSACSRSSRTLSDTASSCMLLRVWRAGSAWAPGSSSSAAAACAIRSA